MTPSAPSCVGEARFKIGDYAFLADWTTREQSVVCPDCGGTGRLRVTFHDESTVSIECANCRLGYDPPTGRIRVYERSPRATRVHINGLELGPEGVRWRLGHSDNCYQTVEDEKLFEDEGACLVFAHNRCELEDKKERDRILLKEKDTHTWAWNASYHRREIKEAERRIAYSTAKLNVAALKAKDARRSAQGDAEAQQMPQWRARDRL